MEGGVGYGEELCSLPRSRERESEQRIFFQQFFHSSKPKRCCDIMLWIKPISIVLRILLLMSTCTQSHLKLWYFTIFLFKLYFNIINNTLLYCIQVLPNFYIFLIRKIINASLWKIEFGTLKQPPTLVVQYKYTSLLLCPGESYLL